MEYLSSDSTLRNLNLEHIFQLMNHYCGMNGVDIDWLKYWRIESRMIAESLVSNHVFGSVCVVSSSLFRV